MARRIVIITTMVIMLSACGNNSDNPAPDAGIQPLMLLGFNSPGYLQSNVSKDATIGMTIHSYDYSRFDDFVAVQQAVIKNAFIEKYPGQQPVVGQWDYWSMLKFKPKTPLSPGDYLIRFPKANPNYRKVIPGLISVSPRPYNLFHVGPLTVLRLRKVEVLRDKGSSKNTYTMSLSYAGSSKALPTSVKLEQQHSAAWKPVTLSAKAANKFGLAQALDTSKRVRVTVSGGDLDGKWTGKAGSGPAVVEFNPSEYTSDPGQIIYHVPPDLDIELPSGKPKK